MQTRIFLAAMSCAWVSAAFLPTFSPALSHAEETSQKSHEWPQKMRELEETLRELLLDISSSERFNAPENRKKIEKNAETLAKLAHQLAPMQSSKKSPDSDPSLGIIATLFADEADHAAKTLAWGHREYARNLLKAAAGYCIACHTRNATGPKFSLANLSSDERVSKMSAFDKANYLAATRQFDAALAEYKKIIEDKNAAAEQPFLWEKALRSALAVEIRVNKNPQAALAIVDQVKATPNAPFFVREQAAQWRKSLTEWKNEPGRRARTEEGLFSETMRLIAAAKKTQKYPADRSADVYYLRASSAAHDLLSFAPEGRRAPEALYFAGLCYEVLQGLNLWDVHEFYYLACIKKAPHTEIAQRCYRNYEESVYASYTGSSGMNLPADVQSKLKDLRQTANPLQKGSQPR